MTQKMKDHLRSLKSGKKLSKAHRDKVIKTLRNGKNATGELNPCWIGGRIKTKEGYILLRLPDHPCARKNGYYPEHRFVMEDKLKRLLKKEEHIHHINGIKSDNRIENLQLTNKIDHANYHWNDPVMIAEQSDRIKKIRAEKFWSTRKK